MKKVLWFIVVAIVQATIAVTPQVKNVKAFQQYPWGKVCVSYEVEGDIAASAENGKTPFLFVWAKDKKTGRVYGGASSGESCLSGETGNGAGVHRVVWDIAAQGLSIDSANVEFKVVYCDELYWVVDLSSGENSSYYPSSFLYAVPSGGWSDEYKTTKLVLRRIAPGSFSMCEQYNVTLTKSYYIGIFELTQKQYMLVMGENPSPVELSYPTSGLGDTKPVASISYETIRGSSKGVKWPKSSDVDSSSFMGVLRSRTGFAFDLPTEAQWEYACRAGGESSPNIGSSNNLYFTVDRYPNVWGLYSMDYNVKEWCLDWYGTLSNGKKDPVGPSSGTSRTVRDGASLRHSCSSDATWLYLSGLYYLGFRVAK